MINSEVLVGPIIKEGWLKVRGTKWIFFRAFFLGLLGMITLVLLSLLFNLVALLTNFADIEPTASIVFQIFSSIVLAPLYIGVALLGIRKAVDLPLTLKSIFDPYRFFWPLSGFFLIFQIPIVVPQLISGLAGESSAILSFFSYNFLVLFALALLLVGLWLYLCIAAIFGGPLIVIENLGPIAALKRSIGVVNQHFFAYAGLFLLLGFLMILSAIFFGLGLIWTLPLYFNAYGVAYRKAFGLDIKRLEAIRVWK